MKTKLSYPLGAGLLALFALAGPKTQAQVPTNFPTVTITTYDTNAVSDGYIFLNGANYVMILNNDGTPIWYQSTPMSGMDVKLLPSGLLHYAELFQFTATAATQVHHRILDNSYNLEETIDARNGYVAEGHDFQMLPNGVLLELPGGFSLDGLRGAEKRQGSF